MQPPKPSTGPVTTGREILARLVAVVFFLVLTFALLKVGYLVGSVVSNQSSTPEAATCERYDSFLDMPVSVYQPCAARKVMVWAHALENLDVSRQPDDPLTLRLVLKFFAIVGLVIAFVTLPFGILTGLWYACKMWGEEFVAGLRKPPAK